MHVHFHSIIIYIKVSDVTSPVVIRKKPAFGESGQDLPAPGQPRKEDGLKTTKRPNINRLKFPSVGVIPGEGNILTFQVMIDSFNLHLYFCSCLGICRHARKVYRNGDEVPSDNPCIDYCMCLNSVVYCDETVCDNRGPPEGQKNCTKVKAKDECCPRYECRKFLSFKFYEHFN